MNCLIINSYAGSLLVAAKQEGLSVIASLEDSAYGIGSQKLNFPDEVYVDREPWPDLGDLSDAISVQHPPCCCFSIQGANASKEHRGVDSKAFQCTKRAISYAMEHRVKALTVESVPATLEGAWTYHDEVATRYGYFSYRVLLNAISFGVPQWRPRFWIIFVRKDAGLPEKMWLHHRPVYRTVGETLESVEPGDKIPGVERDYQKWGEKLAAKGLNLQTILAQEGYGSIPWLAAKYLGWTDGQTCKSKVEYRFVEEYGFSKFSSAWSLRLNPGGFTPTIMATSNFWLGNRTLTRPEYCALAGFPTTYVFDKPRETQAYLSRGVAPPVARWVIQMMKHHLNGSFNPSDVQAVTDKYIELAPGDTADFRVSRKELKQKQLFDLHRRDA